MDEVKKQVQEQTSDLTPEMIRQMDGPSRAKLAAVECNAILAKYNCVFQPMLNMSNNGFHLKVDVIGMAFSELPPGTVICFN